MPAGAPASEVQLPRLPILTEQRLFAACAEQNLAVAVGEAFRTEQKFLFAVPPKSTEQASAPPVLLELWKVEHWFCATLAGFSAEQNCRVPPAITEHSNCVPGAPPNALHCEGDTVPIGGCSTEQAGPAPPSVEQRAALPPAEFRNAEQRCWLSQCAEHRCTTPPANAAEQRGGEPGSVVSTEQVPPTGVNGITEEGSRTRCEPASKEDASSAEDGCDRKAAAAAGVLDKPAGAGDSVLGMADHANAATLASAPSRGNEERYASMTSMLREVGG